MNERGLIRDPFLNEYHPTESSSFGNHGSINAPEHWPLFLDPFVDDQDEERLQSLDELNDNYPDVVNPGQMDADFSDNNSDVPMADANHPREHSAAESASSAPLISNRLPELEWEDVGFTGQTFVFREVSECLDSFQEACVSMALFNQQIETWLQSYQAEAEKARLWNLQLDRLRQDPNLRVRDLDNGSGPVELKLLTTTDMHKASRWLNSCGYPELADRALSHSHRTVPWPLEIDTSDYVSFEIPDGNQYSFPQHQGETEDTESSEGDLGDPMRALYSIALTDHTAVKEPNRVRLLSCFLSKGTVVIGPRGRQVLELSGEYCIDPPARLAQEQEHRLDLVTEDDVDLQFILEGDDGDDHELANPSEMASETVQLTQADRSIFRQRLDEANAGHNRAVPSSPNQQGSISPDTLIKKIYDSIPAGTRPDESMAGSVERAAPVTLPQESTDVAFMTVRLPAGHVVTSPSGYTMNFNTRHRGPSDGIAPLGREGVYAFFLPQMLKHVPDQYRPSLPQWVDFRLIVPMSLGLVLDGTWLTRNTSEGVHHIAEIDSELDLLDKKGRYRVLNNTQAVDTPVKRVARDFTDAVRESAERTIEPYREWLANEELNESVKEAQNAMANQDANKRTRDKARRQRQKEQREKELEAEEQRKQECEAARLPVYGEDVPMGRSTHGSNYYSRITDSSEGIDHNRVMTGLYSNREEAVLSSRHDDLDSYESIQTRRPHGSGSTTIMPAVSDNTARFEESAKHVVEGPSVEPTGQLGASPLGRGRPAKFYKDTVKWQERAEKVSRIVRASFQVGSNTPANLAGPMAPAHLTGIDSPIAGVVVPPTSPARHQPAFVGYNRISAQNTEHQVST